MKLVRKSAKVLRATAQPVLFDDEGRGADVWSHRQIGQTIMMMLDCMYLQDGIGLAAPQVGIPRRLCVVDPLGVRHRALVLINPVIWFLSEDTAVGPEGCLSLPGEFGMVERAKRIRVRYCNRDGLREELDTEDDHLLARVIQHEVDHLHGVLFTDKLAP